MKFLAILKDSFREAVDGWIVYAMLGMSALLILFVACFSFTPVPADEALQHITSSFMIVYPDKGAGSLARMFPFFPQVQELKQVNEASSPPEGDYRFTLRIVDDPSLILQGNLGPNGDNGEKPKPEKSDTAKSDKPKEKPPSAFRQAVAYWNRPAAAEDAMGRRTVDSSGVTDEMMIDFLRDSFLVHGNMNVEKIARRPTKAEDTYEFEVETKGTRGAKGWPHKPRIFFAWDIPVPATLGSWVYLVESTLLGDIGATIAIMVSIIITAFFIPNMMRKGAIDLLLSKPMSRPLLLLYKYIGGMTFVFLNTAFAVGGVWLVIGLRTGLWGPGILWSIPAITFYFAVLYAISTLAAVTTRSAIVAILVTMGFWAVMFLVGFIHNKLEPLRNDRGLEISKTVFTVSDTLNAVLPRTTDLDNLMNKFVVDDTLGPAEKRQMKKDKFTYPPWVEVLSVSGIYIAVMLGLACWRFTARDY
jgi:ABC-type transport system involved in multi-copper enzyme maturation permease subunit